MEGVGWSTHASFERYSTEGMAHDVVAVLNHIGWLTSVDRSLHLCGISMGGMIALKLAFSTPFLWKSLSLLVTCAERVVPEEYKWTLELAFAKTLFDSEKRIRALMGVMFSDEEFLNSKDGKAREHIFITHYPLQ